MIKRLTILSGVIAPFVFIGMTILGGALRPGYSHLSNTISELVTQNEPNRLLLDSLHTLFALLLVVFRIGVLQFFRGQNRFSRITSIGAYFYIAMG